MHRQADHLAREALGHRERRAFPANRAGRLLMQGLRVVEWDALSLERALEPLAVRGEHRVLRIHARPVGPHLHKPDRRLEPR